MYEIAIDGGALTTNITKQFGTYTFTNELLIALSQVDHYNHYSIYTLEDSPLSLAPNFSFIKIWPQLGFMPYRLGLQEFMHRSDIFLALNQSLPIFTRAKILAFCHGLSFKEYPQLYPDSVGKMNRQLENISKRAQHIIVSSSKVANSFNDIYSVGQKIEVVPFGIPHDFLEPKNKFKKKKFIIYVGMNHPIKNLPFLLNVFKKILQNPNFAQYKLLLVGIGNKLVIEKELSTQVIQVAHTSSRSQLQQYFAEAQCVISTSLYESFNLPILEGLSQSTPVVAVEGAVIPELRKYVYLAPDNVAAFTNIVERIITRKPKIPLQKLAQQFNWITLAKKIVQLYDAI